ncbi:EAL domain-containing protein [Acetobacter estunensis]|uniref:EAL domain-containing protein n=1 Tax=Acetobacter estunensis TaxID=104097 RepID=A0A967B8M7_9PROT|nr:EAL domain-containing protein [Acetobacter estunensis]NHO54913.1 EAL domain-containing protein [Acetobacter estunensis]
MYNPSVRFPRRARVLERELADSHRARETLLRDTHHRLLEVIDTVPAMIGATDETGHYVFANRCMAQALGTTPGQLVGTQASGMGRALMESGPFRRQREKVVQDREGRERVFLTTRTPLHGGGRDKPLTLMTALDITELKEAERKLLFLAYHDPLTGAPNRFLIAQEMEKLLTQEEGDDVFGLFLIDLDRFKGINDTLGHRVGDRLLKSVTIRLTDSLPDAEVIGRLGGDEFAIVYKLDGACLDADAHRKAEVILQLFKQPFSIAEDEDDLKTGNVISTTISMGVVIHAGGEETFDALLKRADLAMYRAKQRGGNGYRLFEPEMEKAEAVIRRIELDLHDAVRNDELVLHYQPQVDLRSGQITGVEALLRWRRPDGSLMAPGHFLPVAEETGLIVPITEWVLHEACGQLVRWSKEGLTLRMAVNLSGVLFHRVDMQHMLTEAITTTGAQPAQLELELTESVLIHNADIVNRQFKALRELGTAIAVDDFGTGYASLGYLSRLVIDRIKFDKSFMDRLESSETDQTILRSMIMLCRNLGIRMTAEGIERPEQARWLAAHRCEEGQGFYFGRPQTPDRVEALVRASLPHWHQEMEGMISPIAAVGGGGFSS